MKISLMLLSIALGLLSFGLVDTQPTGSSFFLQTDGVGIIGSCIPEGIDSGSVQTSLSENPRPYLTAGIFNASNVGPLPSTLVVIFLGIVTLVLTRQRR